MRSLGSALALTIAVGAAAAITPRIGRAAPVAPPTSLLSWGFNGAGELGVGGTTNRVNPVPVAGVGGSGSLISVRQVSSGGTEVAPSGASLAMLVDGTVLGWGDNTGGVLGDGTLTSRHTPVPVHGLNGAPTLSGVAQVSASEHGLALLRNGAVVAWGNNSHGELGDGTTVQRLTPVTVHGPGSTPTLTGALAVSAGAGYSAAVMADGSVFAWGRLGEGVGGPGSVTPVRVQGLPPVAAISVGDATVLALTRGGAVYAWGEGGSGEIGNGSFKDSAVPFPIASLSSGVVQVSAGATHMLALRSDGAVFGWGDNASGELGNGGLTVPQPSNNGLGGCCMPVPTAVTGLGSGSGVKEVSAGSYYSLALRDDGSVLGWGQNDRDQLADNAAGNSLTPVGLRALGAGSGVTQVDAGAASGFACVTCDPVNGRVPSVSGVSPGCGPVTGGTNFQVTGTNLDLVSVTFEGQVVSSATVTPDGTKLGLRTPAHAAGGVTVTVLSASGLVGSAPFRYPCPGGPAPPSFSYVGPPCGPTPGQPNVHLTGSDPGASVEVGFGQAMRPAVAVVAADGEISVPIPPLTGGQDVAVSVRASPSSSPVVVGSFHHPCPATFGPTLTAIHPTCGPTAGGPVTLAGANFDDVSTVSFGGSAVPGTSDFARSTLSSRAPAHAGGKVPVTVRDTTGPASDPLVYEYSDSCDSQATLVAQARVAGPSVPGTSGGSASASQGQAQQQVQQQAQQQAQAQSASQVAPAAVMVDRQREVEVQIEGTGRPEAGGSFLASAYRGTDRVVIATVPVVAASLMMLGMCVARSRRREWEPARQHCARSTSAARIARVTRRNR